MTITNSWILIFLFDIFLVNINKQNKMKKIMRKSFVLITILALLSCSSNDSTNTSIANNVGYCNVTLPGATINHEFKEEDITFSFGAKSCKPNLILDKQSVGQVEKAFFFLDIYLVHNDNKSQFEGYNINNTSVKTNFAGNSDCFNNFDLITDYEDKFENNYLNINIPSTNFNKIESVTVYKENTNYIIYAVKGNFEITFKKSDNTLIPVKGSYKTFIYVWK